MQFKYFTVRWLCIALHASFPPSTLSAHSSPLSSSAHSSPSAASSAYSVSSDPSSHSDPFAHSDPSAYSASSASSVPFAVEPCFFVVDICLFCCRPCPFVFRSKNCTVC